MLQCNVFWVTRHSALLILSSDDDYYNYAEKYLAMYLECLGYKKPNAHSLSPNTECNKGNQVVGLMLG